MNMKLLHRIVDIDNQLEALGEREKELKAERERLVPLAIDEMTNNGMLNPTVNGRQIQMRSTLNASVSVENTPAVAQVFDSMGLGDMAPRRINAKTFTSWVREQIGDAQEEAPKLTTDEALAVAIPQSIRDRMSCFEKPTITTKKQGK